MKKITVAGAFVADNVARMKRFPQAGESVLGESIEVFLGGKGINQCVSAARLGGNTEMCGMLGNDENGAAFRKLLKDEKIAADKVFSCDKPTGVAQVQIDENGQNRICVIPSANYEFGFEELRAIDDTLRHTDILLLQFEMRLDVTAEILRRARAYGVTVILNPAPAAKFPEELLASADYLTPNETELSILSGMPVNTDENLIAAAKKLTGGGVKCVVATLGARGALIVTKNGAEIVSGFKVKAVDTVAAGDSFNGAFAVALSEEKSLREAVRFANAAGALAVTVRGAIPSIHTRAQVEAFIRKNF